MTQPAEITSRADWELLRLNTREVYEQIDELYQRITAPAPETDEHDTDEDTEPMADPDTYPHPGYDPDAVDGLTPGVLQLARFAVDVLEETVRSRRDAETDGEIDGDDDRDTGYDPDTGDEPELG